jgi:feruloyl esterase
MPASPNKKNIRQLIITLFLLSLGSLSHAAETAACATLASLQIPSGSITSAEIISAGAFAPPGSGPAGEGPNRLYLPLPEFCKVALTLRPSDDSDIRMEVWLPTANWNGKYLAVGNAAFTGSIRYPSMVAPLLGGYATSSTDTGHEGNTASFGLGHPEKVIDFGWRAVHEMAEVSKWVIAAYYARGPEYSYFNGCSAGGRQAMKEAQRFPDDFDGIIAGAPGLDWTGRAVSALRIEKYLTGNPQAMLLEPQRELLHAGALLACDANDGVTDGVIENPLQCRFDPADLQCRGDATADCLSPAQVKTAQLIYASPANPATGRAITGLLPGSEPGWTDLGWTGSARDTGDNQLKYLVYRDTDWTVEQFDFDIDSAKAELTDADTLNALDPDLRAFIAGGGKLIQYHGWVDPQISPANSSQYYERVVDLFGSREAIHDNYRLFMVPGMGHCGGGPGPNSFDTVSALEAWVESGIAPDSIEAAHQTQGVTDRTRPLCPYPEVAVYNGAGSTDDAYNFSCRSP